MLKRVMISPLNLLLLKCQCCGKHYSVTIDKSIGCVLVDDLPICKCGSQEVVRDRNGSKPSIYVKKKPMVLEYDY